MAALDQKVALGIDFAQLDADLRMVSDKIAAAGKSATVAVPTMGGDAAGAAGDAGAGGGQMADQFAGLGAQISSAVAGAAQAAGDRMATMVARITTMLDKLVGTTVTMFRRIDASMKFSALDAMLGRLRDGLGGAAQQTSSRFVRLGATLASVAVRGVLGFRQLRDMIDAMGDVGGSTYSDLFRDNGLLVGSVMAANRAVTGLGRTIIRIGTLGVFGRASKDAAGFGSTVNQVSGHVTNLGRNLLAAFGAGAIIFKTVQFLKDGVSAAADLSESVSRAGVVFGESFGAIETQAERMTKAFGLSKRAQVDLASGFGAMAQGAGITESASADLANQMTQMAADLSSSVNIPFEEAGEKIRAALAGEAEPLRQFGANISAANVEAYALANGIAASSKSMTDQEKILARAGLVMQGLSYAQGDLERTAGSASNQFRQAGGGIAEFGTRIGEMLLPAVTVGIGAFNELLGSILDFTESAGPQVSAVSDWMAGAMQNVAFVVRNAGAIWKVAQLRIAEFVANAMLQLDALPENFRRVTAWIGDNWRTLLVDMFNGAKTMVVNLAENFKNLGSAIWGALTGQDWEFAWTPMLEGFEATTKKLPDLVDVPVVSMQGEIDEILAGVGQRELERSQAIADAAASAAGKPVIKPPGPVKPDEEAVDGKKKEPMDYRLASAVEMGSKEAYSIIAKSQTPRGNDPAKQTVKAVNDGNAIMRRIEENTRKGPAMPLAVR